VITDVDTNVLLDLLIPNAAYADRAQELLDEAHAGGRIVISEVVYAELAVQFKSKKALDTFLLDTGIRLESSTPDVLHRASATWRHYLKQRRPDLTCPQCGHSQKVICAICSEPLRVRQHILRDFLVGAHAELLADRLLSRNRGYYRRYFPQLELVS